MTIIDRTFEQYTVSDSLLAIVVTSAKYKHVMYGIAYDYEVHIHSFVRSYVCLFVCSLIPSITFRPHIADNSKYIEVNFFKVQRTSKYACDIRRLL